MNLVKTGMHRFAQRNSAASILQEPAAFKETGSKAHHSDSRKQNGSNQGINRYCPESVFSVTALLHTNPP